MSLYEQVAARLIGTPLQRPAEWLQRLRHAGERRRHPELVELYREGERVDALLRRALRADTNCIDIGCHIGSFLQKIVTLAPRGRHHAVEPVPHKAQWLRRRFPQVQVHQAALAERDGSATFFVNHAQTSYSGLTARQDGPIETIEVDCRRLDELIPADARIGFVKIDVNGAESRVLRGATGLFRRDRPLLLLECTPGGLEDYGVDAAEVFEIVDGELDAAMFLPKDHLGGGPALDLPRFRAALVYPFQAFNFVVVPRGR